MLNLERFLWQIIFVTNYLSQTNSEYLQQKNMQRPAIPRWGGPPGVFIFIRSRTEAFVVLFRVLSRKKYGIKRHFDNRLCD